MNCLQDLPPTFKRSDALEHGLSKRELYRLRDQGHIESIGSGLFRRADADLADVDLIEIASKAPSATLCLTTALARHGLSDAIPAALDVAIPRGARAKSTVAPVVWHHFDVATFHVGRTELELELEGQLRIGVYGAERCIIDAFRLRSLEGAELGREALRRWLRTPGTHPSSLLTLAASFPRTVRSLRHAMEILL